ncbi:hypothetical protein MGN70_011320 [Eutypa lata]|nr:hypothetical protein MGN70_011320 [Eutypa lata]
MSEPDADILRRRPSNTFIFDRLDDKKALMSYGLLFGLLGMAVKFFIAQHLPCDRAKATKFALSEILRENE